MYSGVEFAPPFNMMALKVMLCDSRLDGTNATIGGIDATIGGIMQR